MSDLKEMKIEFLEQILNQYDRILIFENEELLSEFCQVNALEKMEQNTAFWKITKMEKEWILDFYFMYEFSDKLLFISKKNPNYADVFSFIDNGVLSREELFEALLLY